MEKDHCSKSTSTSSSSTSTSSSSSRSSTSSNNNSSNLKGDLKSDLKGAGAGGGDPWPESGRGLFQEHGSGWAPFSVELRETVAFVFERLYGSFSCRSYLFVFLSFFLCMNVRVDTFRILYHSMLLLMLELSDVHPPFFCSTNQGTHKLHTSKDGFTLLRPPRSADEVDQGDWSHFDQVMRVHESF
jgi:hypothetical protein